jgi:hypothetical protein
MYWHRLQIKWDYKEINALNENKLYSRTRTRDQSFVLVYHVFDRLCGLVVKVLGYRSGGLGSIPGTTRKRKVVVLELGPLNFVSTNEELLNRKVAVPV